ncbi:MFS transporter [Hoeflea prorocentri]|uniref:MFS transporter n=1 Tax=Hoeflea prorocentri TaxID=1922333 RepID=A0A9X3ZGJ6_9HYPH|nr:MFS transporter [Hoeflea prorocentri]MCY6380309.1 MFS transporter [Hoeflea prorocentri]MDA5398109.1 MFS transporter [Hoeflea prorocentri]
MSFPAFVRDNIRWLAGGFLLTFFSSFGQTFFISLSAGSIRSEFGLSHGEFGTLYMLATLASALVLTQFGRIVDVMSVSRVTLLIVPLLACFALSMAYADTLAVLVLAIFGLRLFGQGMMTHNAITAMGRWYVAQRGRAVSVATIGHQAGEAVLPIVYVSIVAGMGWRNTWLLSAAVLIAVALPVIYLLMRVERQPRSSDGPEPMRVLRHWTRAEVVRDPVFWLILLGMLAPGFIGTTIFFHQVYLVELRGWSIEAFAGSFALLAVMTVCFALIGGLLIDRFSAVRLMSSFLVPLAASCFLLATVEATWGMFAFMLLLGVSYGLSSTLFGALWPEIYGTRHLGAIRAVVIALMVFSTAMGPGVTGFLIDFGVGYPLQILTMGVYCLVICVAMIFISRLLAAREIAMAHAGRPQ